MKTIVSGQVSLILCCGFYLIWWSRCYRPDVTVNRVSGVNGLLLLITAGLGVLGVILTLLPTPALQPRLIPTGLAVLAGIAAYILLLLITKVGFHRIVTTELALITGWVVLEVLATDRLRAAGGLGTGAFRIELVVIAAAFLISMVLYVAYYRMDPHRAFYAAMVPLITEACAMAVLVGLAVGSK